MCLMNGRLDEGRVRQVVQIVIEERRRGYLVLLAQFLRLVRLECAEHTADIESAVLLGEDLRDRINADIERAYGSGMTIRFLHRPELIGGIRVTVGSNVYDGSVQYRLAELKKSLSIAGTNDQQS